MSYCKLDLDLKTFIKIIFKNQPRRELIVVDNHENFNITTYDYDGNKKYSHYSVSSIKKKEI